MRDQGVAMRLLAYTIAVMAISVIVAFATWGDPRPGGDVQTRSVMATVQNADSRDILVHASASGIEWRLGVVHSRSRRSFTLPGKISSIGTYYLIANPAGTHDRIVSEALTVATPTVRPTYIPGSGRGRPSIRPSGTPRTGQLP